MPLRNYYRRRYKRNYRRTNRFIKRSAVKRYQRKMRIRGQTFMKLRTIPDLVSDSNGDIYYYISTTNINLTTNQNGAGYANSVYDLSAVAQLYDQYRVYAVKVKYTPNLPNNLSATTTYKPIYHYVDYDSTGTIISPTDAAHYENLKVFNLYEPWTVYRRIPKTLNPAATGPVISFGWMDMNTPQASGHLGFICDGASASTNWGNLTITYYVGLKNRH